MRVAAIVFLLMAGSPVSAQEKPAPAWGPTLDGSKPVAAAPVEKPVRPVIDTPARPQKPLPKRRSVRSEPITMPAAPRVRSTVAVPTTPVPPPVVAVPPAPIPAAGCDAAGNCRDASGQLLQGGVGNTLIDANGRSCIRHGAFIQCQ
jgi:hypothetical protein